MIKTVIRLLCLRTAAHRMVLHPDEVVSTANDYYRWVIGETETTTKRATAEALEGVRSSSHLLKQNRSPPPQ
jgi:hypothetical protein